MEIAARHVQLVALLALAVFGVSCRTAVPPDRISLDDIRTEFGLPKPKRFAGTIALEHGHDFLSFTNGSRRMQFDDCTIWMNAHASRKGRKWTLSHADRTDIILPLLQPETVLHRVNAERVLLDPGHGGTDPGAGAVTGNLLEKDVVFDIAERVAAALPTNAVTVKLTRTREQWLSLAARTARARREAADLFVSIHANAASRSSARGIETFVLPAPGYPSTDGNGEGRRAELGNQHDQASTLLAYHIHQKLVGRIDSPDRGIKRARFAVLRDAPCPAILVEVGFLSNPREAASLANPHYRQRLATAIADGILEYNRWTAASHRVVKEASAQAEEAPPDQEPEEEKEPEKPKDAPPSPPPKPPKAPNGLPLDNINLP